MQTFEEQKAFFEDQWPAMREAASKGGGVAVVQFIESFDDPVQSRVLYAFARHGLIQGDWPGRDLDEYIYVSRAGIDRILEQAAAEVDAAKSAKLVDSANVISYNLAADLADCWPPDGLLRRQPHFEAGLHAANDCVRWRDELDKPAWARSMAYWAKGMHELSLGDAPGAEASWSESLRLAADNARAEGEESELGPEAAYGVVLGSGLLGLAQWSRGGPEGRALYEDAVAAFESQLADQARKDDAELGLDQLRTVHERYIA
ncbi:MAG: hypothetical protein ACK2T6_00245 [Anaerolineae bacterium]